MISTLESYSDFIVSYTIQKYRQYGNAHEFVAIVNFEDDSMTISNSQTQEWYREFDAAARRSLKERMRYSFIYTYKPVLDDAPYRSFDTMEDYRRWCKENLPAYLGYY